MKLLPLPALFIDLDGLVFNEDTGSVKQFDKKINTSCRHFKKNGYLIFGISHIFGCTEIDDKVSPEKCYAEMQFITKLYPFFKKILYVMDSDYNQVVQFTMGWGSTVKLDDFVTDISSYSQLDNLELAVYLKVVAYLNNTYSINLEDSFFISNNESLVSITDKCNISFFTGRTWLSLYKK